MTPGDMSTDLRTDSAPVPQVSSRATPTPQLSTTTWETLDVSLDDADMSVDNITKTLDNTDVNLADIDMTLDKIEVTQDNFDALPSSPNFMSSESPSSRAPSPSPPVPSTNRSPSQSQGAWTPSHHPLWTLGPQHRTYVHAAAPYLVGVPGGADWEKLLAGYMTFESLSSDRSVRDFYLIHCVSP